ncbi:17706_t:CDS:1, partial [Cetraspora pellucida]
LKKEVFELLNQMWGPHTIDRMASEHSTHLARFNSRWHCPTTKVIDCFTQDWRKEINYVCVPLGQLDQVFHHVIECQAITTIIVPIWISAPWWPIMLHHSH